MNYRSIILSALLCMWCNFVSSQPKSHIQHYGLSDGLPQRSIMDILQDKKGFMWFATWDGLCKYDGYNFTNYKSSQKDTIFMRSNRIDHIVEDLSGYIWVHTYNKETFRFDPYKEKYVASFNIGDEPYLASQILVMQSGKVWLTSEDKGAICVADTSNNYKVYSKEYNSLESNTVLSVFEDSKHYSWILTDNGILRLSPSGDDKVSYYSDKSPEGKMSFFSAFETDTEVWFGADSGRIVCHNKQSGKFDIFDTKTKSDIISIKNIYDNLLIILSSDDGFFICDKNKTTFSRFDKSVLKELPSNRMKSCYVDQNNNIWIETDAPGISRFNIVNSQLRYYPPNIFAKRDFLFPPHFYIAEDKNGHIWVHPLGGGLSYYDKATDRLLPFHNEPDSPEWKFSHMLHALHIDRQGNMWISTRTDGLEKITFDNETFKTSDFAYKPKPLDYEIRALFEDDSRNIWLGSKDNMILIYDSAKNFKGYLSADGTISKTSPPLRVTAYTFAQDRQGQIWIGTKGNGLFLLKKTDGNNERYLIKNFKSNPSDIYSLSNNNVYSVHEDDSGHIWIGTYGGGINLYDNANKRFINHHNLLAQYPISSAYQVRTINSVGNVLYVGTTLGLLAFSFDYENPQSTVYKIYTKTHKEKNGLKANDIFNVYTDREKNIYILTQGGGISRAGGFGPKGLPTRFETYDTSNGLPFDIVLSVIEDKDNKLWVVGEGNLVRFDPDNESFEQFRDVSRILDNIFFSEGSPLLTQNGEIILGCTKGTLSFVPEDIHKDEYSPYIAFIKFRVSGKDFVLKGELDDTQKIILGHKENTFSLEYAALDFANPSNISYVYKMDGLENEWIFNQNQRLVNYTNLPPGEYTFRVKSTNSNGVWTDNERCIEIIVKPSFWQTQWAYLLYLTAFTIALYIILRSIFIFYRMRDRVRLEREQTELKTRFYTDISHEIRTPLTLIVSPIEDIIENDKVSPDAKPQLQLVLKNANRMLNLVNQVLDFRKIQKQKLRIKEVLFGEFITDICSSFTKTAESKGISLSVDNQAPSEKLWIDVESIEKLVYNLISNAIKHTPAEKKININIFRKDKTIALQVEDHGKGMSKEVQSKLFTRFASFNTDKSKPSTGIGLSIVKEIVNKHRARITVESDVGKGSVFTVFFQSGLNHFSDDDNVEIIGASPANTPDILPATGNEHPAKDTTADKEEESPLSILVVEDDTDLRNFIKSVLTPHYRLYEAENGKTGYETAVNHLPDFILSDIMMPEMDGIEFLKKIKDNDATSHIPFILLTAKTGIDDKLEGITSGADDYITKPFNVKLLKAKIENIVKQRKNFVNHLTHSSSATELRAESSNEESNITPQDKLFLKNITETIDKNLDNSELTIDDLVDETSLSRKVFYNKVKSLTGLAPVEFIREIRIKRAAELVKTGEYMVKEVAYMVGFSDIKYFSKCFKHIYGVTPSEYGEKFRHKQ